MNKQNQKIGFREEPLIFFILSLVLVDFLGKSIFWCYLLLPIFLFLAYKSYQLFDYKFIYIALFSIIYPLSLLINKIDIDLVSPTVFFGYFLFPPSFYFIGKYIGNKYSNYSSFYVIVYFIIVFYSTLPFLANLISVIENGFMTHRGLRMIWDESVQIKDRSATIVGSYFVLNMSLIPILLLKKTSKPKIGYTIASFVLFFMGLFSNLNMVNRAWIIIFVLSLLGYIVIQRGSLNSFLKVILLLLPFLLFYSLDFWNVQSWIETTPIIDRISNTSINDESRVFILRNSFKALVQHPFGYVDYNIGGNYAHNLWLDVGRRGGILPLVPLILFSISAAGSIISVSFNYKYPIFLRTLVLLIGISLFTILSMEPIMEGLFILFLIFCFFLGLISEIPNFRSI